MTLSQTLASLKEKWPSEFEVISQESAKFRSDRDTPMRWFVGTLLQMLLHFFLIFGLLVLIALAFSFGLSIFVGRCVFVATALPDWVCETPNVIRFVMRFADDIPARIWVWFEMGAAVVFSSTLLLLKFPLRLFRTSLLRRSAYLKAMQSASEWREDRYAVYLRSFASDEAESDFGLSGLAETALVKAYSPFGPIVAIDNTRVRGRSNGALRVATSDRVWRSVAAELIVSAQVVFIDVSRLTEFVLEEIELAVRMHSKANYSLILILDGDRNSRSKSWNRLAWKIQNVAPIEEIDALNPPVMMRYSENAFHGELTHKAPAADISISQDVSSFLVSEFSDLNPNLHSNKSATPLS